MNKSELLHLIQHPDRLGKQEIALLDRVADDFPYFQGVQVLLTKAYANQKHYEFEKQLHKTALQVPNREVLYHYIQGKELLKQPETAVATPEIAIIPDIPIVEEVSPEQKVDIPVVQTEIEKEPISLEDEQIIQEIPVDEYVPEIEVSNQRNEIQVSGQEPENKLEEHAHEQHTFTEWLEFMQNTHKKKTVVDASEVTPNQQLASKVDQHDEPLASTLNTESMEKQEELKSNIPVFDTILDKFIRESPRISRPKAEFYNPANMAKQSVEEDEDLVTETLAKLYYKQGHYRKAIRAYEKLCLIYPHKMAYFADLIQKIKHENKD